LGVVAAELAGRGRARPRFQLLRRSLRVPELALAPSWPCGWGSVAARGRLEWGSCGRSWSLGREM